ncbi:hypothetical protein HPB51_029141 [Rhipicephalus microplus]|uniref:Acyltransferase 3 domain-containing protein n=1 Tax=Rhipicephalus microplus TaxID=6941 RepID=A0A9J6CVB7_RHIMP|nr:hypothetical protein HPB51_029141 [Rhipicephalus microplus]
MVPVFFLIMCIYLLPLITSGPDAITYFNKVYSEFNRQWLNVLLQVQNYDFDINANAPVLGHLWYLSLDFQYFLVSLPVLLIFKRTLLKTIYHYYFWPFYHAVCYFAGCITFFFVAELKHNKISKVLQTAAWCVALACGLCCIFMKVPWYQTKMPATNSGKLSMAFFDRILWSLFMSWITFACATRRGGFLNTFLSWSAFTPLSRLTFGVYIIHLPFMQLWLHISRERVYYTHFFVEFMPAVEFQRLASTFPKHTTDRVHSFITGEPITEDFVRFELLLFAPWVHPDAEDSWTGTRKGLKEQSEYGRRQARRGGSYLCLRCEQHGGDNDDDDDADSTAMARTHSGGSAKNR